jgi:predicted metallo-beta-lactamase superfamily hydrolase
MVWNRHAQRILKEKEIFESKIKLMRDVRHKVERDQKHGQKFLECVKNTEDEKIEYKGEKNLEDDGGGSYLEHNYENIMWKRIQER